MPRVITFGEIMLRLNAPGHERFAQATTFVTHFGGAEANVAVAIAQLGGEASFITKLPEHELGQRAVDELRRLGVDTSGIVRGGERLGLYFVEHGASQRASRVLYDRTNSAFSLAQPSEFDWKKLLQGSRWLHCSGITPALSANCARMMSEAVAAAKTAGLTISLDVNYRAKLWSPEAAAKALTPLLRYVDVCICGVGEASAIFGIEAETDADVADEFASEFGIKSVVVPFRKTTSASSTSFGALLLSERECFSSPKHEISIVDRVGAGDAMTGALIFSMLRGDAPQRVIDFAAAAGALKHTIPGDFALFSPGEVDALADGRDGGRIQR